MYSFIIDEAVAGNRSRHEARQFVDEHLYKPFDPVDAEEYMQDLWAKKNVAAAESGGLYDDDPHMVGEMPDPVEV